MALLRKIGIGVAAFVLVLVLASFLLPRHTHVERSVVINAHPDVIFNQINTLKNWEKWSPWHQIDPQMQLTYSGPGSGEGAVYSWTSENENVGNGRLEILSARPFTEIITEMTFAEEHKALGTYTLTPQADGTKVTWAMDSDMGYNPIGRYMGLMMDEWVGKDFELGLANIKQLVEPVRSTPEPSEIGMR